MPETTTAYLADTHDPYGPCPVNQDPDYEKWAAYWQEMRQHSITLLGEAFDQVAKDFAAGDARAAIDVLLFCADESGEGSRYGIYGAIGDLLMKYHTAMLAADERRAGVGLDELVKMVSR